MSPLEARVFIVEDDPDSSALAQQFLTRNGHTVVDTASSLPEALAKIPGLGEQGIDVAIVDGNLSDEDTSGQDGETVAKAIKNQHPGITVIGHSASKPIRAAHLNCTKLEGGFKLAEAVTKA